ncbi:hypothetical protein TIFTF001_055266, partial [Ficus carica]
MWKLGVGTTEEQTKNFNQLTKTEISKKQTKPNQTYHANNHSYNYTNAISSSFSSSVHFPFPESKHKNNASAIPPPSSHTFSFFFFHFFSLLTISQTPIPHPKALQFPPQNPLRGRGFEAIAGEEAGDEDDDGRTVHGAGPDRPEAGVAEAEGAAGREVRGGQGFSLPVESPHC